ncbi:MAG: phosphoglycerate kinase [Chloroflexi bacterium]|nr:phosphoglycerate kinase [Chloroflexota bacterium]MCY3583822.1 phosphoglycerate kinase [Chloroflexota bacterium]MCY3716246.1 phosphoglycerate kinase [Chloroflexota bacterium]MDE2650425.1 phosphoglycerate kinase [Chloroflexota bacterium]MYA92153.1 phosphoglycerate kinase [Chloroflexota bacterium]
MNKLSIDNIELGGKRVLVRVDFNVPLADGRITDDTRIRAAIPTLQRILQAEPRALILLSHLGRPKGKVRADMSLAPVAPALAAALGRDVAFAGDCIGPIARQAVEALPAAGVLLLENTRFHPGETANDSDFARALAALGDVFVNDAFGAAHRAHASNVGLARHLGAAAGLLLKKEIDYLATALEKPRRPFIAIIGGAKVSGKIDVIEALLGKVDKLLVGGGMANTFFVAQGRDMANSLVEPDALELARDLLAKAGDKLLLPVDQRIASDFANDAQQRVLSADEDVPAGWQSLDIGPATVQAFGAEVAAAGTVVWNGPMGVFEMPNFALGTTGMARALAAATANGATTIIGGGDSAAAVAQAGLAATMSHISTGGGASLELLEGKTLHGIAALSDR